MSAHCSRSDPDREQDEAIQRVLDATRAAKGWPHTAHGLRAMLASVGLIIVENGAVP